MYTLRKTVRFKMVDLASRKCSGAFHHKNIETLVLSLQKPQGVVRDNNLGRMFPLLSIKRPQRLRWSNAAGSAMEQLKLGRTHTKKAAMICIISWHNVMEQAHWGWLSVWTQHCSFLLPLCHPGINRLMFPQQYLLFAHTLPSKHFPAHV